MAELTAHVEAGHRRQHDVEQHQVGLDLVESVERLGPVAGDLDVEPFALQADGQRVDEGLLVLDDEHRRVRGHDVPSWALGRRVRSDWRIDSCVGRSGPRRGLTPSLAGEEQGERRAHTLGRLDGHLAAVVAGDVADDGETEAGAAGRPRPGAVDPVEPLEDAVEVTTGDADAGIGDRQRDPPVGTGSSATETTTSESSWEYFTALSRRLNIAETS